MWRNGIVRSTVGATATTALVATMMFGGGGFNPAVAAPVDNQDSGVERQLRDAVEGPETSTGSKGTKTGAETVAPESKPEETSKQNTAKSSDEPVTLAVPPTAGETAVINVKVRAVRGANGTAAKPATGSVKLELRNGTSASPDSPGSLVGKPWSVCTVDADGDCSFTVPKDGLSKSYWVIPSWTSDAYYINDTLITGNNTNSGDDRFAQTPYVFRTPQLKAKQTVQLPSTAGMPAKSNVGNPTLNNPASRNTANRWKTNGFFPVSIKNPRFQPTCKPGLSVALVIDLSTSMTSSGSAGLNGAKKAANAMFNALASSGSNANVNLFTFGNDAPVTGQGSTRTNSFVATPGNIDAFAERIKALSVSGTQYTNWDAGLDYVAKNAAKADVAIVLTDGNPTRSRAGSNSTWTYFGQMEEAIFSANAIKDNGTQILAFGVGSGISDTVGGNNLAAVSGQKQWTGKGKIGDSDYAITSDWDLVSQQLAAMANGLGCAASIAVEKTVIDAEGNSSVGNGWEFGATKTTSAGTLSPTEKQSTVNGKATWNVSFPAPGDTANISIKETAKPDWTMKSASCTINNDPMSAGVDLAKGQLDLTGIGIGDDVICKVVNQIEPTSLTVQKTWMINGKPATAAEAKAYGASAAPKLTPAPKAGQPSFGQAVGGYAPGTKVNVNETFTTGDRCVATSQTIAVGDGASVPLTDKGLDVVLARGGNTATITNKINCDATLTLVKTVDNKGGSGATATDWKLSAIKAGGTTNLENVATGTSKSVVSGTYKLSESAGPAGYDLTNLACVNGSTPVAGVDLKNPTVALNLGDNVTCTFTNTKTSYLDLVVSKTVDASFDRDYNWTINKSVDPSQKTVNSATGNVEFNYGVEVSAGKPADSNFKVSGSITVENRNAIAFKDVALSDNLPDAVCAIKTTTGAAVSGPVLIQPGTTTFNYTCAMPSKTTAATAGTNVATATWNSGTYFGTTGKANGSKAFDFAKVSPKVTDGSVTVTDDHFDLAGVEGGNVVTVGQAPKKFEYAANWPGETGKCIDYKNTAKFISTDGEKGQDSETVTLCVEKPLTLDLDAKAAFDRDHDWKIEKKADKSSFNVDGDGNITAGYKVTATEAGHADSNWKLGGTITVKNPNSFGEITARIGKTLSLKGVACTIKGTDADKAEGFQVLVPAGASQVLDYDCDVASGVDEADYKNQTNVATATWGNGRTASSPVKSFGFALAAETDTEITVTDDKYTDNNHVLGTVKLAESPKVFSYDVEWEGTAGKCTTFTNTATIDGDTNHPAGNESSAAIDVCVEKGLTAVKTVDAGFTRDYDWKIAKEAEKTSFTVDENGKAIANYTVSATQEGHNDRDWTMSGSIDVFNPNQQGEMKVGVADVAGIPGAVCTVAGDGQDVTVPAATVVDGKVLPGKATVAYDCELPDGVDASNYEGKKNTATITWTGVEGKPRTADFAADIEFTQAKGIDDTVTIVDDKTVPGDAKVLGTATRGEIPTEFTYPVELQGVAGKCTTFTNTAVLQEEAGADDNNTATADVEVCAKAGLGISKTAEASFDREYLWKLAKKANDPTTVGIGLDGEAAFDYTVTATPNGYKDSNHALAGGITLTNPNEFADGGITATVTDSIDIKGTTCDIDAKDSDPDTEGLQVMVPAGSVGDEAVVLPYTCTGVPENEDYEGVNTATASWKNVAGTTVDATATAAVTYEQQGSKNHEVRVLDDKAGTVEDPELLGTATWNAERTPTEFTYSLTFKNDDELAADGTCKAYTNTATIPDAKKSASETVKVCIQVGAPTVEKTVTGTSQGADGSWNITYNVVVTGDASLLGRYSLEDTLRFGEGIKVNSAAWTGPVNGHWDELDGGSPNYTEELASNQLIGAMAVDTYTVSVNATVAADVIGSGAGNCKLAEGEDGTGFLNSATIAANGKKTDVEACATPVAPEFDKRAKELVQHTDADGNWDGTWDASYDLVVTNPGTKGQAMNYSLTDTPQFAAGVVINDRVVTSETGTANTGWNGKDSQTDKVANQVALEAGTKHTYSVTVNVSFGADIAKGERVCAADGTEGGKGLLNSGTLTSGNESITDQACLDIPAPEANVVKTATGATENPDGTWAIGYTVVVNNNSDVATRYDLTDTLRFGKGLNVTGASWELKGTETKGAWETPGTEKSEAMAEGRALEARSSETYTVTVNVTPEDGAIGSAAATCETEVTPHDRGFLNEATLKHNGSTTASRDCTTPVKNPRSYSMVKTSDPASGETVWPGEEINYTVTVKNTGEFVYTGAVVTDEMSGWQQSATLKEGSLKASGGETAIEGSKLVWTVGDLAVGESKTLTYTITVNAEAWDRILVNVASGNGDVPPSVTTHPTPEYHKLPEPPVVIEPPVVVPPVVEPPIVVPPVVEEPAPELPGQEVEIPETPGTATEDPRLPGTETQVPPRKPVVPLAETGASNATLWIVGSGALAMLLGAGLMVVARRRKAGGN
ncbi:VWA domain-containing protein [Paeniglutamicibacter kerguelensis]|uniref:DUF7927 domain-containing protein n=1 Tax=Paeniglutamicibacter kerguelensis TaxID=254788 RepID=UPI003610782D